MKTSIASRGRTYPQSSAALRATSARVGVSRWVRALGAFFAKPKTLTPLQIARQARWHAAEDYADARKVGDTRLMHATHAAFRKATAEVVRLELAERGR